MNTLEKDFNYEKVLPDDSWHVDFADKLLSENFLLTALEFHAELIESGKQIPKLKEFFSNPGNFENQTFSKPEVIQPSNLLRSSSQGTLDSLDLTRYSEDGERNSEDKVAVLEFELRKAKETINALRANLTEAAEYETNKCKQLDDSCKETPASPTSQNILIKSHEKRALNFLINEYLLLHGYKLTSITFADENENQDFEDWDDVGLNSARPVELLQLYREGLKGTNFTSFVETNNFECQVSLLDETKHFLQIKDLESQIMQLNNKISELNLEYLKKINNLGNEKAPDSQSSLTPEPEVFEIIEMFKSNDEVETKSYKSNGDWTNIDEKFKKEIMDKKSDSQSNFETISDDDKNDNQSSIIESDSNIENFLSNTNKNESQEDTESQPSLDAVKLSDNFNETISDDISDPGDNNCKLKEFHEKKEKVCSEILTFQNNSREIPGKFKNEILKYCDNFNPLCSNSNFLGDLFKQKPLKAAETNEIIEILSESLLKITPNIILNKREEVTPLLILSICYNSDLSVRDKLLDLLFNLKKKPQAEERSIILKALLMIAELKGSNTVENEILPQCWEQITHKYIERRLLVAESCFILAPHVSETIRNSLIISIAQQLLQDKEESIQKFSVIILSLLVALMSDIDKYYQVLEISLNLLNSESVEVINILNQLLFPILAQWSFTLNRIQSDLFTKLLFNLKKDKNLNTIHVIQILLPYLIVTIANSLNILSQDSSNYPSPAKRQEFCRLCKGLCDPVLFYEGSLGKLMGQYDFFTSKTDFTSWPELDWVQNILIRDLLETGNNSWEDNKIVTGLTSTLRHLCLGLGKNVTNRLIKPFLLEKLMECENAVVSGQDCNCAIIPLYLVGVLSTYPEELQEMSNTLRRFICALPLCGVSLTPLQVTVEILSQCQPWQILILDAIWEGIVHQRSLVRSGSASLLQHVIPYVPESLLSTKIIPALVTLTSDPESSVKTAAVPALGMLINAKEKAIRDKVYLTFQTLLQESVCLENNNFKIQLLKTIGSIYESFENKFKEEVIIPQLSAMTYTASQIKSRDLLEVLIESFSTITFSQSQISFQCTSSGLLPGLRNLECVCHQLRVPYSDRVDSMVKEVERRLAASRDNISKFSSTPLPENKRLAAAVSPHVVVEDVKNRVTKIFNTKPSSLPNVSGIFKKKN